MSIVPLEPSRLRSLRSGPIRGETEVPGDKSLSHRALILGAMADGETHIEGLLESEDVLRTLAAVQAFGATADRVAPSEWVVRGCEWQSPSAPIDCGNSGTAARLLMGAAAGFPITATFTGDESLVRRPMRRVLDPLRTMGAKTDGRNLPVTIRGGSLRGIRFHNDTASAQVKSAILFAGLRAKGDITIIEPRSSRDHSEHMLRAFGCELFAGGGLIRFKAKRDLRGTRIVIPGDPSSAAFLVVAALIVPGSELTMRNVLANPLRIGLIKTLIAMGAKIRLANARLVGGEIVADLVVESSALKGVEVPADRAPSMIDEYPILSIAAAFAKGPTIMRGLSELRFKESDRLAAIVAGLRACSVDAKDEGDSLIVEGKGAPPPGGAQVRAFGDHRIAMSFAVMGLGAERAVEVDSAAMIATSFPGFVPLMNGLIQRKAEVETGVPS